MKRRNLRDLNSVTKILLILLIGVILYFVVFSILKPFFTKEPASMMEMMNQMIGSNNGLNTINLVSLIVAIIAALVISFYLFKQDDKEEEYGVLKKALSEDEKKILDEIKKAGEITQDSLRFRLDWSKAKISTILTNLDRKGIIQRERVGKTYKVYLQRTV